MHKFIDITVTLPESRATCSMLASVRATCHDRTSSTAAGDSEYNFRISDVAQRSSVPQSMTNLTNARSDPRTGINSIPSTILTSRTIQGLPLAWSSEMARGRAMPITMYGTIGHAADLTHGKRYSVSCLQCPLQIEATLETTKELPNNQPKQTSPETYMQKQSCCSNRDEEITQNVNKCQDCIHRTR